MRSLDPLFTRLSRSTFRSRFRLGVKERQYCLEKGAPVIEQHAADFVAKRLAPAFPTRESGISTACVNLVRGALYAAGNVFADLYHRGGGNCVGGQFSH